MKQHKESDHQWVKIAASRPDPRGFYEVVWACQWGAFKATIKKED